MAGTPNPVVENGNVHTGKSLKRLNRETCTSFDIPVQQKRQKVSAVRFFPKGCGQFASKIKEKLSLIGSAIAAFVGPAESLKSLGCSNEKEAAKVTCKTCKKNEVPMILDLIELQKLESRQRKQNLYFLQDSFCSYRRDCQMISNQCQLPDSAVKDTEDPANSKYPLHRRVSSTRDFPLGCGRKAQPMSKEEGIKLISSGEVNSGSCDDDPGDALSRKFSSTLNNERNGGNTKVEDTKEITSKQGILMVQENACEVYSGPIKDESPARNHVEEDKIVVEKPCQRGSLKHSGSCSNTMMVEVPIGVHNFPWNQKNLHLSSAMASSVVDGDMVRKENGGLLCKNVAFRRKVVARKSTYHERAPSLESNGIVKDEEDSLLKSATVCSDQVLQEAFRRKVVARKSTYHESAPSLESNGIVKDKEDSLLKNATVHSDQVLQEAFRRKVVARKSTYHGRAPSPERNGIVKDKVDSIPKNAIVLSDQILQELSKNGTSLGIPNSSGKGHDARHQVRETLRSFQATVRRLLRGEEGIVNGGQPATKRIDLTACKILQQANMCLNTGKPILGSVPGVEVGDEFHYRVELSIIGLHRPYQAGIDYINERGMLLATSIVASGGYADDMDDVDVLVYSGQGGIPTNRNKQPKDQKLERGNLALKNSIDAKIPVRVIRGFKEFRGSHSQNPSAKNSITLTYYGLYSVERYWMEKGDHGFSVFKFELRRMPGQAELALKEVKQSKQWAAREGLCVEDISNGEEKIPICAVNTLDDERPLPFKYRAKMVYPSWYHPPPPQGCNCIGGCTEWSKCACVMKNGGDIPFNHNGAIVEMKPLVYECGPACNCPPSCYNRVSQHGIRFRLEIFKTKSRGWGVRSLSSIPSGSFVCEYTGELLYENDAEQRAGNDEYLFDIGRNYNDHSIISNFNPSAPEAEVDSDFTIEAESGFTIDAAEFGSVGRFVNHSCSPNLYTQNVLFDHGDKRAPHIMLFAAENIPPLQELTYDYNYSIGQVYDKDGNVKVKNCYCGSHECTGRLY